MPSKTFTVPLRGNVREVRTNGHVIGDVSPVDIMMFTYGNPAIPDAVGEYSGEFSSWDYEAETVDMTIECDSQAWLDAMGAHIAATPDLLAAEVAAMKKGEGGLAGRELTDAQTRRTEIAKGLEISAADLRRWKRSKGR